MKYRRGVSMEEREWYGEKKEVSYSEWKVSNPFDE